MEYNPRTAVFIDGANHHLSIQASGINFDYEKLMTGLLSTHQLVTARYYTGISEAPEHKMVRNLVKRLSDSGYVMVTKPVIVQSTGKIKANMDIEITVDIMKMSPVLDKIVLFSGDGDFCYLLETVQRMGLIVDVVSSKYLVSNRLRRQADAFYDIHDLT